MQFVRSGPDIPERLLQAHEDERVVLFCGAGISYPAGLPGFARLVEKIYADLSHTPDALQAAAIKAKQFDRAIGLLEGGIVGERETVRKSLAKILTPDLGLPEATLTHEALLTLGRCRDGRMRIVTTNFDRLFEEVIAAKALEVEQFEAPLVPVPKSRWDGLVYLHGLLPGERDRGNLDRLVVSSGDFGLAYLTERWAARFVGELFRHYTVCFVGYSIDDPVLRYMTDALAADRLLGEAPREMFALGSYSKGQEDRCAGEWRAKNVTPILYREYRRHRYLHETLREWAGIYRDGIGGKEGVVVRHAGSLPWASTKQDDFVGRVLWALSDPSGVPARCFADLDPVPSLEWLEPLSEDRYRQADLDRFGVPPRGKRDKDLAFSLIRRPWPYTHAPWMALVDESVSAGRWDDVMFHLGRWLMRHLDDPKLVLWLTAGGMPIHREFAQRVEGRLRELDGLLQRGKTDELNRIREHAPRAIPGPAMRTLWRLLLTGRVKSSLLSFDLYAWLDRFKHDGLTTALRLELRDFLTPRVSVRPFFSVGRRSTRPKGTDSPQGSRGLRSRAVVRPRAFCGGRTKAGPRLVGGVARPAGRFQRVAAGRDGFGARTRWGGGQGRPVLRGTTVDQRSPAEHAFPRLDGVDRAQPRRLARDCEEGAGTREARRRDLEFRTVSGVPPVGVFLSHARRHHTAPASARLAAQR